jgi:hypothetical protein
MDTEHSSAVTASSLIWGQPMLWFRHRKGRRSSEAEKKLPALGPIEQLEDRVTPIVGQYAELTPGGVVIPGQFLAAPQTKPNQGYDGVVKFVGGDGLLIRR